LGVAIIAIAVVVTVPVVIKGRRANDVTRLVQMATGVSDAVGSAAIKEGRLKKWTQKSMESYDLSMTLFVSIGPKKGHVPSCIFLCNEGEAHRMEIRCGFGSDLLNNGMGNDEAVPDCRKF
jgi:hypothetical protein